MQDLSDPVAERARARVGTTLEDKWHLDELLGVGGMAAVYLATHRNGMRVAIKILHAELSLNAEIRSRFLREGYVANKVEHPGAVVVLDDDVADDGTAFLVMELLEGETLAERRARAGQSLPVEEVLVIADQVLDVLAAAQAKGIIHRDIKPDNVFITRAGSVKVLDFGIARLREVTGTAQATQSGELMGTPAYMAPEQARARWDEVDARTDLWSLGATMFQQLAGRHVHEAATINEQLLSAMTAPAPPLASVASGVAPVVADLVDRALAFNKNARWPSATDMQTAVRAAHAKLTGVSSEGLLLSVVGEAPRRGSAVELPSAPKMSTAVTVAAHARVPPRAAGSRRIVVLSVLAVLAVGAAYFVIHRGQGEGHGGPVEQGAEAAAVLPKEPLFAEATDAGADADDGDEDDDAAAAPSAQDGAPPRATPHAAAPKPPVKKVKKPPAKRHRHY